MENENNEVLTPGTEPEMSPSPKKKEKKKKLRGKEKRAQRKQLRREIKKRKKDVYRSKGFFGKLFYVIGKILNFLIMLAVAITVIRVNYVEIGQGVIGIIRSFYSVSEDPSEEMILEVLAEEDERAAEIDALAPYAEDETWAIYMYIVGSDLESEYMGQLSETTQLLVGLEGDKIKQQKRQSNQHMLTSFMDNVRENDLDLPMSFYAKQDGSRATDTLNSVLENVLSAPYDYHAASTDLDTIFAVELPETVKIVFQPGGAGTWTHDMINPNRTQRFVYDSNGISEVYNGHISNMGSPDTLADFLEYCVDEHPADHTMVILWNHGGGPFGYGLDSIYNRDMLSIADIRQAFEAVYTPNENNPPVDIIGFDACLMANMEVANELNGFGKYLLGSEDVEPGEGWDYETWLGALAEKPNMHALQLCKEVTDSYVEYYAKAGAASKASTELFSIIDLSRGDDLYKAYCDFAAVALKDSVEYASVPAILGRSANSSIKYAGSSSTYNLIDLHLFMEDVAVFYEDEANAVIDEIEKAVVYNRANNMAKESKGITVYYPATIDDLSSLYQGLDYVNNICRSDDISTLYYYKIAGCLNDEMQQYMEEMEYGELLPMDTTPLAAMEDVELSFDENGNYTAPCTAEAATITQDVNLNILQADGEGNVRFLGQDKYSALSDENNVITSFKGKWLYMDGQPLALKCVSATTTSIRYTADIEHNGSPAYLMLGYDFDTKEWKLLGVQHKDDSSELNVLADRVTETLVYGDSIVPVYTSYDVETGAPTQTKGASFIYKEKTVIADEVLPNGQYYSYVSMTDARGDVYRLPVVSFTLKNGVMENSEIAQLDWVRAA